MFYKVVKSGNIQKRKAIHHLPGFIHQLINILRGFIPRLIEIRK